ncbi:MULTISPECIES: hypothetical protein [Tenacibaculum]|uniref:Uncharacterized protein n=1 Tax=Tenacibaculum discolor TaxID=361581 RepID=A0A2G1BXH8_9FLAO|nr:MULTISPECIES: hypothetical protein [Tenacibaculum]MDP2540632.1 hypothetical protein [Tenacibaculum discolor]NVK08583.1 hypothetical protein [Tenacibaculum sp.]PHN98589.1 hypothetical protein CSC81_03615 [Tenacibaculum discolor]RLK02334.1 hypothetical protein C8N27_1469 [Tenacibaculum discolor]
MKSYKAIDIKKMSIDSEFQKYISFFQNEYKTKVLLNESAIDYNETSNINNVNDLKNAVYDFFFEPRFENVLDLVKFKKQKPQDD